jgi:hemolysin III
VAAGAVLVATTEQGRETAAVAVYVASLCLLFGVSALYHRIRWQSARARAWFRRLDHAAIFVLVAGTYTPFSVLVLDGTFATAILITVWAGAFAGVVFSVAWIDAPKWLVAALYLALGWVAVATMPQLASNAGAGAIVLLAIGGAFYTAGAVVYARRRPDPVPRVFGYHEIFHALVIAAAIAHYIAVAVYAV